MGGAVRFSEIPTASPLGQLILATHFYSRLGGALAQWLPGTMPYLKSLNQLHTDDKELIPSRDVFSMAGRQCVIFTFPSALLNICWQNIANRGVNQTV